MTPKTLHISRTFTWLFRHIKTGTKTLEIRIGYPNISAIRLHDRLNIECDGESTLIQVVDIRRYGTFEAMLKNESPERIAPGMSAESILNGLRLLYGDKDKTHRVVVLEIEIV